MLINAKKKLQLMQMVTKIGNDEPDRDSSTRIVRLTTRWKVLFMAIFSKAIPKVLRRSVEAKDTLRAQPFFDRIRAIGHQPFIQIGIQSISKTDFLICSTQEELVEFADALWILPQRAKSPFLSGMHAALSLEFYDAGELFFKWCLNGDEGISVGIFSFWNKAHPLRLPLEFPIFAIFDPPRATQVSTPSKRAAALTQMLTMYHETTGNDVARWSLIEGLALGLSKFHGSLEEYATAHRYVEVALRYSPKSIHLRAAQHALDLKLAGKDVPDRLVKFIGADNGALIGRVCPEPFKRFDIGPSGETLVCCGHWVPTPIGNIMTQEVEDVLNSPAARKIRASVLDGSYKYCNHLECSALIQGYLPKKETVTEPVLRRAIDHGKLNVDKVEQMLFAFDQSCNLSCPSCRVKTIIEKPAIRDVKTEVVTKKLMPLLSGIKLLDINPAGEVFASKPSRRILEMVNREKCPDLCIDIISNGTLFTEKEWQNLPNLRGMVRAVRISTDGATKATFEKLRRLASWEVFLKNMRFLAGLRARGEIKQLKMSFTYQIDNFREMKQFVEFGKSLNVDFVIFERLQNLGAYTWEEFRAKAVHLSAHPLHAEFLETIRDPIFGQAAVWHDFEWEGAARLSESEAVARLNATQSIT